MPSETSPYQNLSASWEVFVEDLMVDCLNRDSTNYAAYMDLRLKKHLPRAVCRAMLTGLGYVDFRGVSDIKKTAKRILVDACNPFSAITGANTVPIDEFTKMRNYLAHYSIHARRSLLSSYRANHKLKHFREPADFLYARSPKTGFIRFADYVLAYAAASQEMRKKLGV